MIFYILLLLHAFLYTIQTENNEESEEYDRVQLHNELNKQLRNYLCCAKHMKCCKRAGPVPAEVEIRATLLRCPPPLCGGSTVSRRINKSIYNLRNNELKQFPGFDEDEPIPTSSLTNCRKKLAVTMKTSNVDIRRFHSEYVVIDHVFDPMSNKKQRLLTPYVIKFKQEPIMQMYGMKFLHVVNSHTREDVINKHSPNYTGCDTGSRKPTCGRITYRGKVVPFSEGFCCSCDPVKNHERQPDTPNEYPDVLISYSDPAFVLDGIECPKNLKGGQENKYLKANSLYESLMPQIIESFKRASNKTLFSKPPLFMPQSQSHIKQLHVSKEMINKHQKAPKTFNEDVEALKIYPKLGTIHRKSYKYLDIPRQYFIKPPVPVVKTLFPELYQHRPFPKENYSSKSHVFKRQVLASGAQRRGGQNCADRHTPVGLDPETYHESAHCLRFSDLWYTVYRLQEPMIEHSITFQVFEKHEGLDGHMYWKDVTKGKKIRVGTIVNQYIDEKDTLSIRYKSRPIEVGTGKFALDYKISLLLVPEGVKKRDIQNHPEVRAGPPEYLVVHSSQISLDGDQCNVGGVGFEAFVKQPNRCARPKGTCLLNQPYHLWKHDYLAEQLGKKGCFFLKYYGKLPRNPIRKHTKTKQKFLLMEYPETYTSTVDFEIKADFNTLLRPQSPAVITEVYIDSTSPVKTILTVKITNSGLVSSSFIARLSDCPLEMPASFNNIESQPVLIPPQHQHIFHLKIKCILPADRFHCSVEALTWQRELIAIRRVRLQKMDRCLCTWHCLCSCIGSLEGLQCVPMSLQQYHAAGFQGSLPVTTHIIHYTLADELMSFAFYIVLFLILILLMLGLCKAMIGICCSPVVGVLGLDVILDLPKPIRRYYESDIFDRRVIYDDEGWPVHPDTKERVRSIARSTEFCMNIIFFFAYPINVFILLIKRLCFFSCQPRGDLSPAITETPTGSESTMGSNKAECCKFLRIRYKRKGLTSSLAPSGSTAKTTGSEDYSISQSDRYDKISAPTDTDKTEEVSPTATSPFSEGSYSSSSSDELET